MKRYILLMACADAAPLRDRIADLLAEEGTLSTDPSWFPEAAEATRSTVALVVLSPRSLADPAVATFLDQVERRRLPLLPVVDDLNTFDLGAVPIPALAARNAVGFEPGGGETILRTVRGYFGLEAFPEKKRVFISYARKDGSEIAQAIYDDLWNHRYTTFLDIHQIEKGAVFQERIREQIADKDFVLLIDTPAARQSSWVRAEITEAQNQRIQVRVLAVGQVDPCPLVPSVERLVWDELDPDRLERVRGLVARGIGSTASFDQRCHRMLAWAAELKSLRLVARGRRRVLIQGHGRRVLFEYEQALPSLESLHLLYQGYRGERHCPAVLLSGDQDIGERTLVAVSWARGRAPLEVCSLLDIITVLDRHFT